MISKHFKIHELVPKHIYEKYGESAWRFIDSRLIESIDRLKIDFPKGTITINNYKWGGVYNWSGFRTPKSPDYSETSMHNGRAGDLKFSEYKAKKVRAFIIKNPDKYPHIKGIEMGVSWVHIDTRNEDKLVKFKPHKAK